MRFKLREKLVLITTTVILLSTATIVYLNLRDFMGVYKESISKRVFAESSSLKWLINDVVELGLELGELAGLNHECERITETIPYAKYCFIMGNKGEVYYHSSPKEVGNIYSDSIAQNALKAKGEIIQYYTIDSGENIYDFSQPIEDLTGSRIGLIRIGVRSTIIDKEVLRMAKRALWLGVFFVAIACVLTFLLFNFSILIPIRDLMKGVSKIGRGELDNKIELRTSDEFGELAVAFDKMAEDLKKFTVSIDVLHKEQKRFQDVAANTGDWIWEVDAEGRYTYSSPVVEQILGYKPEELIGKHFYDFFRPSEREKLKEEALKVFKERKLFNAFSNVNITKDGREVIIETSGLPVFDADGNFMGYRGVDRDVTERKKAEEQYRMILQTAIDGFWITDIQGRFLDINDAYCRLIGYSRDELLKMRISDVEAAERPEEIAQHIQKIMAVGGDCFETRHRCKDRKIIDIEISVNYTQEEGGRLFVFLCDITERKKAEEERASLFEQIKVLNLELEDKVKERTKELEKAMQVLEEANIQLQEANAHKNKFLSTMSHELRTPLNGIIGFTDLLKGQFFGPLNEKQMSYVAQVENSSKHLLSLIDGLLTIIKVDMGKVKINIEKFNIEESVKAVVDMLKSQLNKKNVKLSIECDPQLLEINTDNSIFKQILLSLLDNAIKYTPEEGSITIRSSMNSNNIMISVTDTGIGIEPKDQEKLFSEFYQVDRVRDEALGGMGIGLALTKRLVNLQSGEIGVESELGKGSTFWFTLPQNVIPNSFRNLINDGK